MPAQSFRKSIWVISSRLMIAPSSLAFTYSSAGVTFDENMIFSPVIPQASLIISSARDEQSVPQPSSFRISKIYGLGVAFTAKYSLKPLFQPKAFFRFLAFSLIPFSS